MCCEATDALLEFVRRYLGLTGLRNLNAPRRLKLRVPVLKEWLQRQGQGQLAASIPDWDPVRRPTGRWKSWEMANLKPIMDEKAVERQAKRQLVGGENAKDAIVKHEAANHNEAAAALVGLVAPIGGDGEGGDIDECGADGGAEEEEEEEELPEDAEMVRTSEEGINFAHKRISELVAMLARYEAVNSNQKRALNSARVAADQFKKCLEDGKTHLSVCKLRDVDGNLIFAGSSKAIVPQPPIVQQNHSSVLRIAMASSSSSDRTTPRQPNMAAELEENSQGSQALLELAGASQISLTGLMASQEVDEPLINSQESAAPPLHSDDTASPQRPDPSDPEDMPSRRSHRRSAPTERAEEAGLRKRPKLEDSPGGPASALAPSAIWPPAGAVAAAGVVPMPSATYASTYEEPMGSQEQVNALDLLGSQCSAIGGSPLPERAIDALPRGPSPLGQAVPQQAVA